MPLFSSKKQFLYFLIVAVFLFCVNLSYKYIKFYTFLDNAEQNIIAKVERDYLKTNENNKTYRILLLNADEFKFYTIAPKSAKVRPHDTISLKIYNIDVKFIDFLKGIFYMPSSNILRLETLNDELNLKDRLIKSIANQHENSKISEFYTALFLAMPVSAELRQTITLWGIAHLIAISGFHLGLILAVFYFILSPVLRAVYAKICPYRDYKFDIFIVAFTFISLYLWILGLVPSFFRAYILSLIGFLFVIRNIKILSFLSLFVAVCLCVAIFPSLILNVGFYFSLMGVFYIFLYIHHFGGSFGVKFHAIFINFYLFFVMQVVVLYFFPIISIWQFSVIPLTYIFSLFYPLSFLLHLFEVGGIFDEYVLKFINFKMNFSQADIKFWQFLIYNTLSFLAIKFKGLAMILPLFGVASFVYIL